MLINGIDYQIKSTTVTPPASQGSFGRVTCIVIIEEQGNPGEFRFTFEQERGNRNDDDIVRSSQAYATEAIALNRADVIAKQAFPDGFHAVDRR